MILMSHPNIYIIQKVDPIAFTFFHCKTILSFPTCILLPESWWESIKVSWAIILRQNWIFIPLHFKMMHSNCTLKEANQLLTRWWHYTPAFSSGEMFITGPIIDTSWYIYLVLTHCCMTCLYTNTCVIKLEPG